MSLQPLQVGDVIVLGALDNSSLWVHILHNEERDVPLHVCSAPALIISIIEDDNLKRYHDQTAIIILGIDGTMYVMPGMGGAWPPAPEFKFCVLIHSS